jgi:hypothetical protein
MPNKVKFLILDNVPEDEAQIEAAHGTAPVRLMLQFEGDSAPNPTSISFVNRNQLERTFELAGLAPCLLDPTQFNSFWSVTDEQLQKLTHPLQPE